MPRYAVSTISFFDNELVTDIVEASDSVQALRASKAAMKQLPEECFTASPGETEEEHIERLKEAAFDCDGAINVVLIP